MSKTKTAEGVADALLDAHVAYLVDELTGEGLRELIALQLDGLLADAARLKLKDVVSARMIKDTARTYAAEIELGGGLPELVSAIARALYAHKIHDRTALKDVVAHARYEEFVDKLLELRSLREKLLRAVVGSPIYIAFASDLLYHGIKDYLARGSELTRNLPGAGSVMKLGRSVLNKASPGIEHMLDDQLRRYVAKSVEATSRRSAEFVLRHLNEDALRRMTREIWDKLKFEHFGGLREDLAADDIEDLFVIGYEFWRELRKTEIYTTLIDAGIDAFFELYGNRTLSALLDEIGVTRQMMLDEAMHFAPHVLKVLKRKKLLEAILRRGLEGFYRSGAVERVLAVHG
ncbi:hypothetical protein [Sinimarinibacterium thermocellulolyticum]|uniref:Uncharacterized protein n=1 Tax=Sinimarinibacterium thermocellulolyticum TaxID=3170016 RepID=A0ABV2A9A5_9GAMM